MPDRTGFLQLNDLAKHGGTLVNLIWPFAGGRHNWPPDAAQLWPSAYDEWYEACRALLDPDLWQVFARHDQGDRSSSACAARLSCWCRRSRPSQSWPSSHG